MKKSLIIVHVEEDFEHLFPCDYRLSVARFTHQFDHVINVESASVISGNPVFPELECLHQETWVWGFDAEYYEDDEDTNYIEGVDYIPTNGHPYSFIEPWMKELPKDHHYVLIGGCRSECLQDVIDIFDHLEYEFEVEESLTF